MTKIKWLEHPEMVEFMCEYVPGHSEQEIRAEFRERFGITLTEGQIGNFKTKYHLKSGTKGGCFQKGHVPMNKGQKVSADIYEKMAPTMFRKGNIPPNHRPVGSERINVDGYVEIKVAEPNKWRAKHRVVYEEYHGEEVKKGEVVIFLDGNRLNFEVDNLIKLTRAELVRYNQDHLYCEDKELSLVAANIARIKAKIKQTQ